MNRRVTLRGVTLVFVHQDDCDFRYGVALSAEDDGKNAEESDRQNETQCQRRPITAQRNHRGADDGQDQSRNSLPVRCKNTDSRFGRRKDTSTTSRPALVASSNKLTISVGRSTVNCAVESTKRPPRCSTHALTPPSGLEKRASTWLREAKAFSTSSSLVPWAMMRPWSTIPRLATWR
jgi:hypothetical protein